MHIDHYKQQHLNNFFNYPLRSSTVVNSARAFFTAGAVIVPSSGLHCIKKSKQSKFDVMDLVHLK